MPKNDQHNYSPEDIALILSGKTIKSIARELKRTPMAVVQKRNKLLKAKRLPTSTTPIPVEHKEELPAVRMAAKSQDDPLANQILLRVGGKVVMADRDGLQVISVSEHSVLLQYSDE